MSELQAISSKVGFNEQGTMVSLLLDFRAENDNKVKGLPRSFLVKSLESVVGPEEERKLCPVRSLKAYLKRSKRFWTVQASNLIFSP